MAGRDGSRERKVRRLEERVAQLTYENDELKRILASLGPKAPRKPAATTTYDSRRNAATG
jgi:hypothetical protein